MRRLRECCDEELLLRVIADDRRAFDALVGRYAPRVLSVCMHVLRQQQDAEEACQDTFVVLCQKADSIQDKRKLSNWLCGVARRKALRIRKSKQRRENHEHLLAQLAQLAQTIDEMANQETQAIVRAELQHLPKKYQVPLVLCYLEDKNKEEVAAELNLPVGTVSCQLARGRELLRRRLAHYDFMGPR